jgi:predicted kinase
MAIALFILGHAGAGKTYLARELVRHLNAARRHGAWCLLDKDTVGGPLSAALLGCLTGDPLDRDSDAYRAHVREPECRAALDVAAENLALGVNVVLPGPFSRELARGTLFDACALGLPADTHIVAAWKRAGVALRRERILARGDARDRFKLANWDNYLARLAEPNVEHFPRLTFLDADAPIAAQVHAILASIERAPALQPA